MVCWTAVIYQHFFNMNCFNIHGLCLTGKVSTLLSVGKVELWELIWLCPEVERCIMQHEPGPLLPKTAYGRCWPAYWWLDSTFICLSKHRLPAPPSHLILGRERCGWSLIHAKPVYKKQSVFLCCCLQSGAQNADAMQPGDHRAGTFGPHYRNHER